MAKTNDQLIYETLEELFPVGRREKFTTFARRSAARKAIEKFIEKQLDNHFPKTPSENYTSNPNKPFCDAPGCF